MAADRLRRGEPSPTVRRGQLARALERAPGLVERLSMECPFPNAEAAVARAREILAGMTERERIAVLDAHPRIGADPRTLSDASRREQSEPAPRMSDTSEGPEQGEVAMRELAELNDEYERRFGFRFVVFVAGRPKSAIVPILRERLRRSREEELAAGLEEFLAITLDRLLPA